MPLRPGPCEHCGSPDRSRQCRYDWYLPNRDDWKKSGADAPCYMDEYEEDQAKREPFWVRHPLVTFILTVLLFCVIWYILTHIR